MLSDECDILKMAFIVRPDQNHFASVFMAPPTVFIVDDDPAIRDSLSLLLESHNLPAESHASAESFLAALDADCVGCLVLDVSMPGMSGPALQAELLRRDIHMPILFLTAHGDIPTSVGAMRAGADDFLTKPPDIGILLDRITQALHRSRAEHEQRIARRETYARLATLTPRESEILAMAVAGHANKHIARELDISFRTVEVHRSNILHKMAATTFLELALRCTEQAIDINSPDLV